MEQALISGVACDDDEAKVTIEQVPDRPGVAAEVFRAVADGGIHVDMIVQNSSREGEGRTDLSFTVPKADLAARWPSWSSSSPEGSERPGTRSTTASRRCRWSAPA